MKKILSAICMLLFLGSCNPTLYETRKKTSTKFKNKAHRISHKKKNRRSAHRPQNATIALKGDQFRSPIPITNVNTWINSYVTLKALPFPQYFMIKSTDFTNFFAHGGAPYLHVYLSTNNTTGLPDLSIVGCRDNLSPATGYNYVDFNPFNNQVFGNFYNSLTHGIVRDEYLEGNYPYAPYPTFQSLPASTSCLISTGEASERINRFQRINDFEITYSFIIDNEDILPFLQNTNRQYNYKYGLAASSHPLTYIQIYLALENNNPNHPTIILVGLDNEGNHIYYTTDHGNSLKVFNTAVPCPFCLVDPSLLNPIIPQ